MDIGTITDINFLKALAYDQIMQRDQAQSNLDKINIRISQLINQPPARPEKTPTADDATVPEEDKGLKKKKNT